jgi:hypothetical protein
MQVENIDAIETARLDELVPQDDLRLDGQAANDLRTGIG